MMKRMFILLLITTTRLWPQAILLTVDDTTYQAASPHEADSVLTGLLTAQAQRGELGATYRLDQVATGDTLYHVGYSGDQAEVLPADSVIVLDTKGRQVQLLSKLLAVNPVEPGEYLDFGKGSVWQINRRTFFLRDSGYGATYLVEDRSVQTLEAVATWDDSGDRGRVVGVIRIEMPNLLGPLRHFSLDFRRLSEVNQTTRLSISEPKLPWLAAGLQLSFSQELRDTLFVLRESTVGVVSRPKRGARSMIGIGWRQLHVTSHGEKSGLLPYAQRNMQVEIERSTLSGGANPTRGYRYRLHASGGTLSGATVAERSGLLEATFALEWLASRGPITFSQDWQLQGVMGLGFAPGQADFARIGGGRTLRGYREDQFVTPWAVIARHELRYGTGQRGRLYLLSDIGLIDGNILLAGTGFGLKVPAGANSIMVEMAWSPDNEGRFDINAAKIHLRVLNILSGNR